MHRKANDSNRNDQSSSILRNCREASWEISRYHQTYYYILYCKDANGGGDMFTAPSHKLVTVETIVSVSNSGISHNLTRLLHI
mmetsp:Transcript_36295/g.58111  ORF Transcript_36295/g.58111 Transcript_36295/m.58111 type:complete len:83 (-) Transcript_36295:2828-3076(-)